MADLTESWRPVIGYEGRYDVSDLGRVRSVSRVRSNGKKWTGRILRQTSMPRGYRVVSLWFDNKQSVSLVHRLVLESFAGPAPEGTEGLHRDGDPANNALANLSWGTHSQNQYDQVAHGTHGNASKDACPSGHPYSEENTYVYPGRPHRGCRECRRINNRAWKAANPERAREQQRAAERRYRDKKKVA